MSTAVANRETAQIAELVKKQRAFFRTGATKNPDFRKEQLQILKQAIEKYEEELVEALHKDLNKHEFESYATEIGFVLKELDDSIAKVHRWAKPRKVGTPLFHFKAHSRIKYEPYGVTLTIAPWNYPFQLLFAPVIGALAAGNTAVLKPSEHAPHTSAVSAKLVREAFDESYIAVVEGGVEVSKALTAQKWDYIFFTGGTEVGRLIYQAAAKHLTPVTLELGGKSPCIVDKDTNIKLSARRIAWGKFINAGQTCIAPDYLLVHREVKAQLIDEINNCVEQFYSKNPQKSDYYCRIINDNHFERLRSYLDDGLVVVGGQTDASERYIAPTLLDEVQPEAPVMQEEIFGPILPVLTYDEIDEAIEFINGKDKPLALYIFSTNSDLVEQVLEETSSGGTTVNDTIMHIANPALPFGGVGNSGIGAYHGSSTFELFSHARSILYRSFIIDLPVRYAPYKIGRKLLKRVMKWTL